MVKDLKSLMIEHLKGKLDVASVTPEMVVENLVDDFPEVVLLLAEENYLRGYAQGLADVEYEQRNNKKQ